jgi:hypothetical protein
MFDAVVGELAGAGFVPDVPGEAPPPVHLGRAGGWCELNLLTGGQLAWEYHPGQHTSPRQVRDLVMTLLGGSAPVPGPLPWYYRQLQLHCATGRDLASRRLTVGAVVIHTDPGNYQLCTGIEVTSPVKPAHGLVHVAEDRAVLWRCPLTPDGVAPQQIAAAITAALTAVGGDGR